MQKYLLIKIVKVNIKNINKSNRGFIITIDTKSRKNKNVNNECNFQIINTFLCNLPIVIYSALPDENLTIIFLTDAIQDISGYSQDEFYKRPELWNEIKYSKDKANIQNIFKKHHKNKSPLKLTYRIITKSGEIKWLKDEAIPIFDSKKKISCFNGFIEDITEWKKAEENEQKLRKLIMHHSNNLAAINKELESFSYSVSHDLRAPLRSINGFSQALLEDYSDKLDKEGKDFINRVKKATNHMERIIDDLLKLAHISRQPLEKEKVNITDLSKSIINELKNDNLKRQVIIDIADNLEVICDRNLIQIVLENLLENALKFTSKNQNAKIKVNCVKQNGINVFFIKDNGVGFDMKFIDKLFTPFQRLHTNEEFSGDGIGLSIVARIIHRHGGKIWAEAEMGKGAIFYFTLGETIYD